MQVKSLPMKSKLIRFGVIVNFLNEVFKRVLGENWFFILEQLVKSSLTLRYRRTFLGYVWTLLNPFLMMGVTSVVFSTIFKLSLKEYTVFLFSGMISYSLFSQIVSIASDSIISHEGLIKKIPINKVLFPLSVAITCGIDGMLMFFSLLIIMLFVGAKLSTALFFLPISFLLLLIFSFGIGLIFSVMTVYFRDLRHIIGVALQALMFLSPVLYKPEQLAGKIQGLMALNPMTYFIELFRSPVYFGIIPQINTVLIAITFSIFSIFFGMYFFKKYESKIIFYL